MDAFEKCGLAGFVHGGSCNDNYGNGGIHGLNLSRKVNSN